MLIIDQLKKDDSQLRWLSLVVLSGLLLLLVGLWWVQAVMGRDYEAKLQTQSFRTVRIPPMRGKILDRNGIALADSRPSYNVSLYLEDLRKAFGVAYDQEVTRVRTNLQAHMKEREKQMRRELTAEEKKPFTLTRKDRDLVAQRVRFQVASNVVARLGTCLQQPLTSEENKFQRHYAEELVLPLPVVANLDAVQIARFLEQSHMFEGMDLVMQPMRFYPYQTAAAHLLGQLKRDRLSADGEDAFLNYPLPVYQGTVGIEAAFDTQLRGRAGTKSVLVNNLGYRQGESIWTPAEPGQNVVLTIDLPIQQAAEQALQRHGAQTRGAVVVMEAQTGDVLALASSPTYDVNQFIRGMSHADWERMSDAKLRPQVNRATQENYAPGSIFKIVTGLACLDAGLNPAQKIYNPPQPSNPAKGCIQVGQRLIHDLAPSGEYDFRRAFLKSSNTYFITNGLRVGIANIVKLGQRLHLGERTGLPTRQEVGGVFLSPSQITANWRDGDTANVCIGQGPIAVTPLQMAVMVSAIANGGKVFWPRLVDRLEPQDPLSGEAPVVFPKSRVRNELGVKAQHLKTVRDAMLADVEDPDGTGRAAAVPGLRLCGKTGTAEVENERKQVVDQTTWFVSFAPYENPRYVVVVMVESGDSGGGTCGPIARDIYAAIQKTRTGVTGTLAHAR